MAPQSNIRNLLVQTTIRSCTLFALVFQFYGLVMTYKVLAMKRNLAIAAYYAAKKSKIARKMKLIKGLRMRRKARSVWFQVGRTDRWWQNLLGEDVPESGWKKNFRMTRHSFFSLADELRPARRKTRRCRRCRRKSRRCRRKSRRKSRRCRRRWRKSRRCWRRRRKSRRCRRCRRKSRRCRRKFRPKIGVMPPGLQGRTIICFVSEKQIVCCFLSCL